MSAERHHFVPQGYLRGFAIDDASTGSFVWVYDKNSGRVPRKKSVRSIAWAPAYYAQDNADGTKDMDTVETNLARTIDNKIPQILKHIVPKVGLTVQISPEDKDELAFFVGLSMTRVPNFRDGLNALHTQVAQIGLSHLINADPKLVAFAKKFGVKAVAKPWVSIQPMIEMAQLIATAALAKNWQFFVPPPGVSLVTSDNPVVFSGGAAGITHLGPAHPQAELLMNLRKDLALVCTPKQDYQDMQVFRISPSEARKFNRGVVRAARQRVFADHNSETFDSFVKKYAGEEQCFVV
jgi:hypothetical protein